MRKRLVEEGGEVGWLKKGLAETQAELESSRNEVEGLRRLNSAKSGSVSSVSCAAIPPCLMGGGGGGQALGRRTLSAQRRFPHLALGLWHRDGVIRITGSTICHQREVGMIAVSTGGNCPLCFKKKMGIACGSLYVLSLYIFSNWKKLSWTRISYEW